MAACVAPLFPSLTILAEPIEKCSGLEAREWAPVRELRWPDTLKTSSHFEEMLPRKRNPQFDRAGRAKLADQPKMGRAVPESDSDNIREPVLCKTFRIIYVLRADRIQILGIIHAARDLELAPSKPWDVV